MSINKHIGLDGFVWFIGVVEDRNDPTKLGRVKVRCVSFHTDNLNDPPTKDLPWAQVMQPTTSTANSGKGISPFIVEGTWVVGFFLDAETKQQPIVMGTLPGKPANLADTSKGFNDPNGKYPLVANVSDLSDLAQGVAFDNSEKVTSFPINSSKNFFSFSSENFLFPEKLMFLSNIESENIFSARFTN